MAKRWLLDGFAIHQPASKHEGIFESSFESP
jgi:hypothetical protein